MSRKFVQLVYHPEPLWVDPAMVTHVDGNNAVYFANREVVLPIMNKADFLPLFPDMVETGEFAVNKRHIVAVLNDGSAPGEPAVIVVTGGTRINTDKSVEEWLDLLEPIERAAFA